MPNLGKPASLKLITGSRRRDKATATVALPTIDYVPKAPDWLPGAQAVQEWDRLAPILVSNKLLTEASLSVLAHACSLHGVIVRAMASGNPIKAATLAIYRQMLNDFGLTPSSSAKVAQAGQNVAPPDNVFARRGKRP
jgi:phage terminase small subunit